MRKFTELNESKDDLIFSVKMEITIDTTANSEEEASFKAIKLLEDNDKISNENIISIERKSVMDK